MTEAENAIFESGLKLKDISGVGNVLERKLISHFGSEGKALETLFKGDVHELCKVEGMTKKAACSLILNVSKEQNGVSLTDFLKTKEAETLYFNILKMIKKHCHTEYAADFTELLVPYPKKRMDLAMNIQKKIASHLQLIQSLSPDEQKLIASLLSMISPVKSAPPQKVRDRVILAFSESVYLAAREKFGSMISVHLVTEMQECFDFFNSYPAAILFDFPEFELPDFDYDYFKDMDLVELEHLVPEMSLSFFVKNLKAFDAALKLAEILVSKSADGTFSSFSADTARHCRLLIQKINPNGDLAVGSDIEADRLKAISLKCDDVLLKQAAVLSEQLKGILMGSTLTLDGSQLMTILSGADLKTIVQDNVSKSYRDLLKASLSEIAAALSLKKEEELSLSDIFGDDIVCPVVIHQEVSAQFKKEILGKLSALEHKHKKQLSKEFACQKEAMTALVSDCLEFDCWYSAAVFAQTYHMTFPKLEVKDSNSKDSNSKDFKASPDFKNMFFDLKNGRNLFLTGKHGFDKIIPVSYDVENIVLLSGVNSGGKTSLLELIGQCLILAHMGFPVPAESFSFSPIEEFYYFGKSKGTLDAGAFETTLRHFSIVSKGVEKAVFADELESITEPGASSKIIAGLMETFYESGKTLSLFVSHLSEAIAKNCDIPIRVDGIEAGGLDDHLNLIVNRNPIKNHVAKSTPELIVEKLFLTSKGEENAFYKKLRGKFSSQKE